jgi:hypothetical protein
VYNRVYAASVSFKVREDETYVLEGAKLSFRGTDYTTDSAGQVVVPEAVAGTWTIGVTKDGYTPYDGSITLKKGDNGTTTISLKKVPEQLYGVSGSVNNFVTSQGMAGVQVSFAGKTLVSDTVGEFGVQHLAVGDYDLTLSKDGFTPFTQKIHLTATKLDKLKISLVPKGNVIFASNRDNGKRALYVSNYDGGAQTQLVTPVAGTEDYALLLSPDGKNVIFNSTRDKVPSTFTSGGYLPKLYIVGVDGKNLKKVNDAIAPSAIQWSSNSHFVIFTGYATAQETVSSTFYYDVAKAVATEIGPGDRQVVLSNSGNFSLVLDVSYDISNPATFSITIIDMTNNAHRILVDNAAGSADSLSISADGAQVFYELQGNTDRKRYQVAFAGGTPVNIALVAADKHIYVLSPDGKTKSFIDTRDGKTDIFTVDASGANETRLTTLGTVDATISLHWDTTGTYLTFASVKEGETALYIVAASGGTAQKVADFTLDS